MCILADHPSIHPWSRHESSFNMASHGSSWLYVFVYIIGLFAISGSEGAEFVDPFNQYIEARQLKAFESFRDVQIFYFHIPPETLLATWEFVSNGTRRCDPKPVSVYLQHGSYPIPNPDNTSFPRFMVHQHPTLHLVELQSDSETYYFDLATPMPGDWFAVAFLHQDTDQIKQKGLFIHCEAWLASTLKLQRAESVILIIPGFEMQFHQRASLQYYKFFAQENTQRASISIQKCSRMVTQNGLAECPLSLFARPSALPVANSSAEEGVNCSAHSDPGLSCRLELVPLAEGWNYIMIQTPVSVEYTIVVITEICENHDQKPELVANLSDGSTPSSLPIEFPKLVKVKDKFRFLLNDSLFPSSAALEPFPAPEALHLLQPSTASSVPSCPAQQTLVRNTLPGYFTFEYVYPPDENGSTPLMFNISNHVITRFRFQVFPIVDIGGTLAVELALSPFINTTLHNVSVAGCLQHNLVPVLNSVSECTSNMTVHANTSSDSSMVGAILVPFPESGNWYVSLQIRCYFHEQEKNESEVVDVPCETPNTSIILRVKSAPCILGQCGTYGRCYEYLSGGFLFSSCVCSAGWSGWGCTDGSKALSDSDLLIAVLLLTLSNILFIPTIILALYRRYYTESLVYVTTMVFSTFYHACDAEVFSFCLLRLSVLQFCDFYSAILSFWVTIMAMADLPESLRSILHVGGAIGVALGVEYDRTGLLVFMGPFLVGVAVLCTSWGLHCYQQRACFPQKKTWLMCLLPGIVLVTMGLILFAFLQTKENYAYTHSAWHATMALAVLFLLPERRYRKGRDDVNNTCSYIRIEELSDISPSIEYGIHDQLLPPSP